MATCGHDRCQRIDQSRTGPSRRRFHLHTAVSAGAECSKGNLVLNAGSNADPQRDPSTLVHVERAKVWTRRRRSRTGSQIEKQHPRGSFKAFKDDDEDGVEDCNPCWEPGAAHCTRRPRWSRRSARPNGSTMRGGLISFPLAWRKADRWRTLDPPVPRACSRPAPESKLHRPELAVVVPRRLVRAGVHALVEREEDRSGATSKSVALEARRPSPAYARGHEGADHGG